MKLSMVLLCSVCLGLLTPAALASPPESDFAEGWLELCQASIKPSPETAPATRPRVPEIGQESEVPWKERIGPAYPGNVCRSFLRDARDLPASVWDDTKASLKNRLSLAGFAVVAITGITLTTTDADDCVEDHFTENGSQLNSFWDSVGDVGGNPGTHFAVAGAMYVYTLALGDTKNYEVSKALINALALNGAVTLVLKVMFDTESPNGDDFGWPSGHASSSFAFATVMAEYYGPWVGVPLFAFASYVGYERIDARNHDFSDVISGAFLGMAIGHAVAQNHVPRVLGLDIIPYADPSRNAMGVALIGKW